jgi:hypothetical protein
MTSRPQRSSIAFRDYVQLLLQLHNEMSTGDPDGERADEIRDEMDRPWSEMTEAEHGLVNGLSADLYTIGTNRPKPERQPPQDVLERFKEAIEALNWPVVLELTREHEQGFDAAQVAEMRGVAWMHLGVPQVALQFFEERMRLGPRKTRYRIARPFAPRQDQQAKA